LECFYRSEYEHEYHSLCSFVLIVVDRCCCTDSRGCADSCSCVNSRSSGHSRSCAHNQGRPSPVIESIMHIAYFSPISTKFIHFPYFCKIYFFCLIYVSCSPYFDHEAFMHHALQVLDAPAHSHSFVMISIVALLWLPMGWSVE